ncbi:MAG: hypothetical protein KY445_12775 [Armatimonadetes bacterium]|nr:hypothetical protein [Armatimonadota bacterium]
MKIPCLLMGLALTTAPVWAQTPVEKPVTNVAPLPATLKMATATPFITGLQEAQGMAFGPNNEILVADYKAGEILRFSRDGKSLGKLATGLKGPSAIVSVGNQVFVSERKANRVVRFQNGKMDVVMADVAEPMGLVVDSSPDMVLPTTPARLATPTTLNVVSHTTSKIYRSDLRAKIPRAKSGVPIIGKSFNLKEKTSPLIYAAPVAEGDKERYGFRWLVRDGATFLMSDEVGERILMLTESGRTATFASGISDPSGIAIGPDKMVYVANEGDGGQLIRLDAEGEKTVIAEKLGRPRGILFLDAKTVLVSNRDGGVWKIALP